MSKDPKDCIQQVIDVSNELIASLDTRDFAVVKDSTSTEDKELLFTMEKREKLIHQLFENFDAKTLELYASDLTRISILDKQLVIKISSAQKVTKSIVLQMKKNKKAINTYQKL